MALVGRKNERGDVERETAITAKFQSHRLSILMNALEAETACLRLELNCLLSQDHSAEQTSSLSVLKAQCSDSGHRANFTTVTYWNMLIADRLPMPYLLRVLF